MIIRLVEYGRVCDGGDDCPLNGCVTVANWDTRKEAEAKAIKDGWTKRSAGRWLCPYCTEWADMAARKAEHDD
jgi:hypothetical protein